MAGSMPGTRARRVGSWCWLRLLVLDLLPVRDDVGPTQPAREIHIGAAARAEGAIFCVGGAAADRTLGARDRGGIGLLHAPQFTPPSASPVPPAPPPERETRWRPQGAEAATPPAGPGSSLGLVPRPGSSLEGLPVEDILR